MAAATAEKKATRGTTNGNDRGSSYERRRRREWLVQTYRADVDAQEVWVLGKCISQPWSHLYGSRDDLVPACRCYRCGALLTVNTVTVDRIIPGCQGGTYRRDNIRPCCGTCNSITGGSTRSCRG